MSIPVQIQQKGLLSPSKKAKPSPAPSPAKKKDEAAPQATKPASLMDKLNQMDSKEVKAKIKTVNKLADLQAQLKSLKNDTNVKKAACMITNSILYNYHLFPKQTVSWKQTKLLLTVFLFLCNARSKKEAKVKTVKSALRPQTFNTFDTTSFKLFFDCSVRWQPFFFLSMTALKKYQHKLSDWLLKLFQPFRR